MEKSKKPLNFKKDARCPRNQKLLKQKDVGAMEHREANTSPGKVVETQASR
jgi:hypothetical protein